MRMDQLVGSGLMFHQVSLNVMLVAVAYSCTDGLWLKVLTTYAVVSSLLYMVLALIGGLVPKDACPRQRFKCNPKEH